MKSEKTVNVNIFFSHLKHNGRNKACHSRDDKSNNDPLTSIIPFVNKYPQLRFHFWKRHFWTVKCYILSAVTLNYHRMAAGKLKWTPSFSDPIRFRGVLILILINYYKYIINVSAIISHSNILKKWTHVSQTCLYELELDHSKFIHVSADFIVAFELRMDSAQH